MESLKALSDIEKNDKKGLAKAIELTLIEEVSVDFDKFIEGLDLTEDDKFWILGGFVNRKTESLEDPEVFFKFIIKVLGNYKTNKEKERCIRRM